MGFENDEKKNKLTEEIDNFFQSMYGGNIYMERAEIESESYEGIPY